MVLNNCRLCGKVHKALSKEDELCPGCRVMHDAQYKVTLNRIEKLVAPCAFSEISQELGGNLHVNERYLSYRFDASSEFTVLDNCRNGYCYLCNQKMYHTSENACLDCLQKLLALLEKRSLNQSSRMGTGRKVTLILPEKQQLETSAFPVQYIPISSNNQDMKDSPSSPKIASDEVSPWS